MRIFVDIRHLSSPQQSGVGVYTEQILRSLFEIDKTNDYILFSSGRTKPILSTHHITTPNKLLNLRSLILGHPTINWHVKDEVDLLFLPNLNITLLPNDVPSVLTIHDLSFKIFPECYSKKMQLWHRVTQPDKLAQRSHIIAPSKSTKQDTQQFFSLPDHRISVIPHGLDPMFRPNLQAQDHGVRSKLKLPRRYALFLGTLEPRKNVIAIIDAVKKYREETNDDLHLVLAGKWGWKNRELKKRLWRRDVRSWVHNLGYVEAKDKPALYRSAQVFVWPSLYEGFGLPVLEAMACGTPVISSITSSIPEITDHAAILVSPYHTHDITEALKGVLQSKSLREKLSKKGVKRAQTYTWRRAAEQTLKIFQQSIKTRF